VGGGGVIRGVLERHSAQCSSLSFLHIVFFPLSSPFTSPSVRLKRERKKRKKQASISPARRQQQPLFYLLSEGPDDSSGQAHWMKRRSVWGGEGGGHTKGLATDISWKLLYDVSAHQRTATAIVGLVGRWRSRRRCTVACFSVFSVLHENQVCTTEAIYFMFYVVTFQRLAAFCTFSLRTCGSGAVLYVGLHRYKIHVGYTWTAVVLVQGMLLPSKSYYFGY